MKLEVRSIGLVTLAMVLGISGMIVGFLAAGAAAFLYPFSRAPGTATLVAMVLGGTVGGALLGFVVGLSVAWAYNAFASLSGGIELELKETEEDD